MVSELDTHSRRVRLGAEDRVHMPRATQELSGDSEAPQGLAPAPRQVVRDGRHELAEAGGRRAEAQQ